MDQKNQKISFPLKKIEALIRLAVEHQLLELQLGPVRIVPNRPSPFSGFEIPAKENGKEKKSEPISRKEWENIVLFGTKEIS